MTHDEDIYEAAHMATDGPLYPDVQAELIGQDGNAFYILGAVSKALRRGGHGDAVDAFMAEAMSGDYNHLLATAMQYVEVT